MDESSKESSGSTSPSVVTSSALQPSAPKAVYLSVFDRVPASVKSPTDVSSPANLIPEPLKNPAFGRGTDDVGGHIDMMPESSSSSVCEFCLSKEEMYRLQNGSIDKNLAGDKASSTIQQTRATIIDITDEIATGQSKDQPVKEPIFPCKTGAAPKTPVELPTLRLRDIQLKLPQKATAVEALGKYFNVSVVSPKLEAKSICAKMQQEQAEEIPRTKSEEFTPMAQEEEEVKRLIEEVRMAGEPGDHGEGKETIVTEESTVVGELKVSELKPTSIASLKKSESSELSLQSVTSSVRSLDYGPDMDDSGLEDELEEMVHRKFVLLRRIPNTFPFSKDCLNVMDVTDRDEYEGKGEDDPHPVVTLTVRGIVPLNPDGTPLPYRDAEPEMSQEVDLNCHCCHVEVLPTMSDDDIDEDELEEEEEMVETSSAEELRRSFGMKDTSLSSLDALAQTVSGSD